MPEAALGIRAHSGWGALVAICANGHAPLLAFRKRLVIIDPAEAGSKQPYHFVENWELPAAQHHIAACAANSERLAEAELREAMAELGRQGLAVRGCAILEASGRALPGLEGILKSHSLIHAAEGEFFRSAFRTACERLGIVVTGYRERDLEQRFRETFGRAAEGLLGYVNDLGKTVGPPWTADQKKAALAALLV